MATKMQIRRRGPTFNEVEGAGNAGMEMERFQAQVKNDLVMAVEDAMQGAVQKIKKLETELEEERNKNREMGESIDNMRMENIGRGAIIDKKLDTLLKLFGKAGADGDSVQENTEEKIQAVKRSRRSGRSNTSKPVPGRKSTIKNKRGSVRSRSGRGWLIPGGTSDVKEQFPLAGWEVTGTMAAKVLKMKGAMVLVHRAWMLLSLTVKKVTGGGVLWLRMIKNMHFSAIKEILICVVSNGVHTLQFLQTIYFLVHFAKGAYFWPINRGCRNKMIKITNGN